MYEALEHWRKYQKTKQTQRNNELIASVRALSVITIVAILVTFVI